MTLGPSTASIMPAKFRGFGSDVFLLRVGPEQTELIVQRDILTQIPYFAKALSSNAFSESVELTFNLPDDDPSAVSEVLWFVLVGSVPPIEMIDETPDAICEAATVKVQSYVKACIAADRLMVDDVKRKILEMVVVHHQDSYVDADLIATLSEAGHHGSALYAFFIAQLASDFHQSRNVHRDSWARDKFGTSSEKHVEESGMSRTDLCRLLSAMNMMVGCDEDPSESGFWLSGPDIEKHEDVSRSHEYTWLILTLEHRSSGLASRVWPKRAEPPHIRAQQV